MSDLDQIIDLGSARDMGFANTGAVNASVGLNFHVIFNHCRPGLDNFVPAAGIILGDGFGFAKDDSGRWPGLDNFVPAAGIILGETKTIAADDYSILQDHVIADAAML